MTFHRNLSGELGVSVDAAAMPTQGWVSLDLGGMPAAGFHAPLAPARNAEAPAPTAGPPKPDAGGGGPGRRIPAQDIVVIGRRPAGPRLESEAVLDGARDGTALLTVPRLPLRRLVFRAFLVVLLIGEIALAAVTWPREPIAVPDASRPGNMIG